MYGFTQNMEMAFAGAKAATNMTRLQELNICKQVLKLGMQSLHFSQSHTDRCGNIYPNRLAGAYVDKDGTPRDYQFALNTELPGPDLGVFADGENVIISLSPWERGSYASMKNDTVVGYWFTGEYYRPVMKSEVTHVENIGC